MILANVPAETWQLTGVLVAAIALILFLILKLKVQAFITLLVASVFVALASDKVPLEDVGNVIVEGMGSSLGFIAAVVGLGAIFGQLIEHSGGAQSLAHGLLSAFGEKRASWAMMLTGFLISIPVFLDVGIVILAPILYALTRRSGKSLLYYGLPLGAGMAVTHAFVPPTPGPVAVAHIMNVPIGQVIFYGCLVGLPAAIISGPVLCPFLAKRVHVDAPEWSAEEDVSEGERPSLLAILVILCLPVLLILGGAITKQIELESSFGNLLTFLGHPVIALLISTLLALYYLGYRRKVAAQDLMTLSTNALGPAGVIILITGAGGVFKQMLGTSGVGQALADLLQGAGLSAVLLAWLFSTILRVAQGSATVAMLGAAALMGGIVEGAGFSDGQLALLVVAIAAGATGFSHVNDSGFWIISRYFNLTEKQTLQTWFFVGTTISIVGLVGCLVLWGIA